MTNEEYLCKKINDTIDEEYQKYLKSLNIPSKEEWLKMEHKEETKKIKHKFNVGDIIVEKLSSYCYTVKRICDDGTYELTIGDGAVWHEPINRVDMYCFPAFDD